MATLIGDFGQSGRRNGDGRHMMLASGDSGGETGEESGERLGLGVVQQSGGSIGIDSKLGEGTTVRIYLPVAGALAPLG